jgi:multicomponent Na+:H+ antiporter subunit D
MGYAGAITALVAVVLALSQKDAKRLLAYHSISQIGYVVSAWGAAIHIGVRTETGTLLMTGAYLHAVYHALFKGLLFLSVGTTIDCTGERNVYRLRGAAAVLREKGERFPLTLLCFFIGALAISAVPPLNGYASKSVLTSALKGTIHYYLLAAAAVGTVASFVKLSCIYWGTPARGHDNNSVETAPATASAGQLSPAVWISQSILGILCIAGGVAAPFIYPFVLSLLSPGGEYSGSAYSFYSADNLIKTAATIAFGLVLFRAATTPQGAMVLKAIRERPRSFQGLYVSFALGFAALAVWLLR